MSVLIQIIITGISIGAVYGLFALSIAVLYRLTGIVHLAIGESAGVAVFATITIVFGPGSAAGGEARMPVIVGAVLALALATLCGALVHALAVRPFLKRGFSVAWIGGIVAAAIIFRGAIRIVFPRSSYTFPEVLPLDSIGTDGVIGLGGGASIRAGAIASGLLALVLVLLADRVLKRSRYGAGMRACASDRLASQLCGVPVDRLMLGAFALASLLAGGVAIVALSGSAVSVNTFSLIGLKGVVAAVAARFGAPLKVVVAAIVLGIAETAIGTVDIGAVELGPAYSDVIPIALTILLLASWRDRTLLQEPS